MRSIGRKIELHPTVRVSVHVRVERRHAEGRKKCTSAIVSRNKRAACNTGHSGSGRAWVVLSALLRRKEEAMHVCVCGCKTINLLPIIQSCLDLVHVRPSRCGVDPPLFTPWRERALNGFTLVSFSLSLWRGGGVVRAGHAVAFVWFFAYLFVSFGVLVFFAGTLSRKWVHCANEETVRKSKSEAFFAFIERNVTCFSTNK